MWRYLLLLFPALPLGYLAYLQVILLLTLERPTVEPPSTAGSTTLPGQIAITQQAVKEAKLQNQVYAAYLTLADRELTADSSSIWNRRLAEAHHTLTKQLEQVRRRLQTYSEELNQLQSAIRKQLSTYEPTNNQEIEALFTKLEDHPAAKSIEPDLVVQRMAFERKKLEFDLNQSKLPDQLEQASTVPENKDRERALVQFRDKADELLSRINQFLARMDSLSAEPRKLVNEHYLWAKRQQARLEQVLKLRDLIAAHSEILLEIEKSKNYRLAEEHLTKFAEFRNSIDAAFVPAIQRSVERFGEEYLPRSISFDNVVRFHNGITADRENITIHWKRSTGKAPTKLIDSGYNEFTLPEAEVDLYEYDSNGGTIEIPKELPPGKRAIEGTSKSKVAHFYNEKRKALKWTTAGLEEFRKACDLYPEKGQLTGQRNRLEAILQVSRTHPELFQ